MTQVRKFLASRKNVAPPPWRNCWRSDKKPDWRPTSCSSPQLRIRSQIHRIRIWTIEKSVSWSTCKIDSHISSLSSIPLNKMSPTLQKKPARFRPCMKKNYSTKRSGSAGVHFRLSLLKHLLSASSHPAQHTRTRGCVPIWISYIQDYKYIVHAQCLHLSQRMTRLWR